METNTLSYLDIDYYPETQILSGYMSTLPVEKESEISLILPETYTRKENPEPKRIGFI